MGGDDLVPVIGVRLAEGRSGSTLLMQLLATSPQIVFDDRYPSEYRFLSYFARMAAKMTEPFDEDRHVGVTPFFFDESRPWGPVPFSSDVVEVGALCGPLLNGMWSAWSATARSRHPTMAWYAEKLAVGVDQIVDASIPLRIIDLVRDPRDVLASIRAFTAKGIEGFGWTPALSEDAYLRRFIATFGDGLQEMATSPPGGVDPMTVQYEDLVRDLSGEAARLGEWLGVELDADVVESNLARYAHHVTAESPAASIGRWRRDLRDRDAAAIAEALGPLAAPFGYDLG